MMCFNVVNYISGLSVIPECPLWNGSISPYSLFPPILVHAMHYSAEKHSNVWIHTTEGMGLDKKCVILISLSILLTAHSSPSVLSIIRVRELNNTDGFVCIRFLSSRNLWT